MMRMRPKTSVNPLASRSRSAANVRPLRMWSASVVRLMGSVSQPHLAAGRAEPLPERDLRPVESQRRQDVHRLAEGVHHVAGPLGPARELAHLLPRRLGAEVQPVLQDLAGGARL